MHGSWLGEEDGGGGLGRGLTLLRAAPLVLEVLKALGIPSLSRRKQEIIEVTWKVINLFFYSVLTY